jgi:hypothetical protein
MKFQVIIFNDCRVLEAIPSEKWDAAVFGSSMVAQKISHIETNNLNAQILGFRVISL